MPNERVSLKAGSVFSVRHMERSPTRREEVAALRAAVDTLEETLFRLRCKMETATTIVSLAQTESERQSALRKVRELEKTKEDLKKQLASLRSRHIAALERWITDAEQTIETLQKETEYLQRKIMTDPLTGELWNQRGWHRLIRLLGDAMNRDFSYRVAELQEASLRLLSREGGSEPRVIVVGMDVDRFKEVNDRFGHATGDAVLRTIGRLLQEYFRRGSDLVARREGAGAAEGDGGGARVGGDEFYVAFKASDIRWVPQRLQEFRRRLREEVGKPVASLEGFGISAGVFDLLEVWRMWVKHHEAALFPSPELRQEGKQKELLAQSLLAFVRFFTPMLTEEEGKGQFVFEVPLGKHLQRIPIPHFANIVEFLRAASKEIRKVILTNQVHSLAPQWWRNFLCRIGTTDHSPADTKEELRQFADAVAGTFEEAVGFYAEKLGKSQDEYLKQFFAEVSKSPHMFTLQEVGVALPSRE